MITTYTLNRHLNPFDITVQVNEGTATLHGTVESDVERDLAEELARSIEGIQNVNNELTVDPALSDSRVSGSTAGSDRSFARKVDDANITAKVKSQLLANRNTGGLAIDVDTFNGHVTLTGSVDSTSEADLAEQIALNTDEVAGVDNQLTVGGEEATLAGETVRAASNVAATISDGWITTKVKSALLYNRNVDGTDIDVDTKDGVVTLRGKVDSASERSLATSIASDIKGVKSVDAQLTGS